MALVLASIRLYHALPQLCATLRFVIRPHLESQIDQFGSRGGGELQNAMLHIAGEGRGIVVLMREPTPSTLSEKLQRKMKTRDEDGFGASELRDYGVGAQILLDLGIKDMVLLTDSEKTVVGRPRFFLSQLRVPYL